MSHYYNPRQWHPGTWLSSREVQIHRIWMRNVNLLLVHDHRRTYSRKCVKCYVIVLSTDGHQPILPAGSQMTNSIDLLRLNEFWCSSAIYNRLSAWCRNSPYLQTQCRHTHALGSLEFNCNTSFLCRRWGIVPCQLSYDFSIIFIMRTSHWAWADNLVCITLIRLLAIISLEIERFIYRAIL